jgi:hypothetical protein
MWWWRWGDCWHVEPRPQICGCQSFVPGPEFCQGDDGVGRAEHWVRCGDGGQQR